jgi:hypothetical protein
MEAKKKESDIYFGIKLSDKERYLRNRKELSDCKQSIVSLQFAELLEIIGKTRFAQRYFNESCTWFNQKLHYCTVLNKEKYFTASEINIMANAYRDLTNQLLTYAEELDAAKDYSEIKK